MTSLLSAFRSAVAYSAAGTLMSRGQYFAAAAKIEEAKSLAGSGLKKPSLLNYFMRAAYIHLQAGDRRKPISICQTPESR